MLYPEKGKTYTLSAYVKTENISSGNEKGASVFVDYKDGTGAWHTIDSEYISGTNDWERLQTTFTLPADSIDGAVYVNVGIVEETGTAYFDCIQLEDGSIANRYNLVENTNFTYDMDESTVWIKDSCDSGDTIVTSSDSTYPIILDSEKKVFKINGSAAIEKGFYQTINVAGNANDIFTVAGWAKGDSVDLTPGDREFSMYVGFQSVNNPDQWQWEEITFNQDSNDWQFVSGKAKAVEDYKAMKVYYSYYKNENTAYFDGMQLYKEEFGQSYDYDDNGNLKSVSDLAEQNSQFEYNSNNDLVKATSATTYVYDSDLDRIDSVFKTADGQAIANSYSYENDRIKAITHNGFSYNFLYDSLGNNTEVKVGYESLIQNIFESRTSKLNIWKRGFQRASLR